MAIIARSERSVTPNPTPLPTVDANGDAIGQAVQKLGTGLASFATKMADDREDLDDFETNMALTKFHAAQDLRQRDYDNAVTGDGRDHTANRLTEFDQDAETVLKTIPNNSKQQQKAQLFVAKLRGSYGERSLTTQLDHIDTYKAQDLTNFGFGQVVPQITGDIKSVDGALAQIDVALAGTRLPDAKKAQVRQALAKAAFDRWFDQSGADGKTQAEDLITHFGGSLPGESIGSRSGGYTDDTGMEFLRKEESFAPVAKWDYKQYSVGYGTRGRPGEVISREEADRRLKVEVGKLDDWISGNITVPLTQAQHNSLVSFGFNLGDDDLDRLKDDINAGNFDRVASRMKQFNRAGGVVNKGLVGRRARESAAFEGATPLGPQDETGASATSPGPVTTGSYFVRELTGNLDRIGARAQKLQEQVDAAAQLDRWMKGEDAFNAHNDADKDIVDKAFARAPVANALFAGDETAMKSAVNVSQRLNYVPKSLSQSIQGLIAQPDPERRAVGYRTASAISAKQPYAFDAADGGEKLRKDAATYTTLVSERGLTPSEAVAKIDEMASPEWKKLEAERRTVVDNKSSFVASLKSADLQKALDPSWWFFRADLPENAQTTTALMADYRRMVRENYIATGDEDLAQRLAAGDLKRMWGVSNATGTKTITKYPPEAFYPGVGGDANYMAGQLEADVKEATGKDVPLSKVTVQADARTQREIANVPPNQTAEPTYVVTYTDDNGLVQRLPGRWRPDPEKARATLKEEFETARAKATKDKPVVVAPSIDNGMFNPGTP